MNYIELQRMRKAAGLGWGWVNNLVGDDNFVSDIFGNDRYDRLNNQANQFRQQMNEALGPEAIQRQQLTSQIGNARQRNYQAFNRNNLSGYTQDQINAINAAAQKKGLKMGDITQVSFNDKGAVNGFRVRKGTLNQQPQQPVATRPNAQIASTPTNNVYDARKI